MALLRKNVSMQVGGPPRGRCRLKRKWMEVVKIDINRATYLRIWLGID